MTLWIAVGLAAAFTALWLVRPFLTRSEVEPTEAEHAISIYQDQRDELQRDAEAGLISAAERDAAEQEIERRALRAGRQLDTGIAVVRRTPALAAALALLTLSGSLGLYSLLGAPEAEDQPLLARKTAVLERRAEAGDLESRAMLLVEKVREDPESFEDWWLLAQAYASMGDYASAADAYRTAVNLSDDDPAVLTAYAEALTLANGNRVPTAAKLIFTQAREAENNPRARYYLALAKAQDQDFEGALVDWLGLYNDSLPEAPWMTTVRRDIVNMARFLQRDLKTLLPDATEAELAKVAVPMPDADGNGAAPSTAEIPETEIAALEAILSQNPKNWEAWIRLARLQAEAGDSGRALAAIEAGRRNYEGAPFVLGKFDETARDLNLEQAEGPAGPSDAEVAAAAELSEDERAAMVRGMVEGLDARLQEQPDDLDGWLMLIRSYAVLQDPEAAGEAVRRAQSAFQDAPAQIEEIVRLAESLGVTQQ